MKSKGILGIIIVVFIIGIVIYGFSSNSSTPIPTKTYNGTYLSFTYPSSWSITGNSTNTSLMWMKNDNTSYFMVYGPESMSSVAASDNVGDNLTYVANSEFASTNLMNITNINVNGVPGVMAYTNSSWTGYNAQVYFAVGDNLYWYHFYDANPIDDSVNINEFFMLINSTKAK
ncbi:MAG: hypothetical protein ACLQG5_08850 [Methanobacterium sp.]|jgi:MFS superfamily sulfate permease-like transporter